MKSFPWGFKHGRLATAAVLFAGFACGSGACSSGDISPHTSGGGGEGGETWGTGAQVTSASSAAGTASGGAGSTTTAGSGGGTTTSSSTTTGTGTGGSSPAAQMCARWNADRADRSEGTWSGSVASCSEGDISAQGRANALKLVNLYRFIAGLPAVTTDPVRDQKDQACALMMDANNQLSHSPPSSWACYSTTGAEAASKSNISPTPGVEAVDLYMADPGNTTTMGHRRWILSGSLGPIGIGSTDSYSCMWVLSGLGNANPPFTAWPSPGPFPFGAINASFASVDETGWTIQSTSINLSGASVTITDAGTNKPVAVTTLLGGYGSSYAIRMVPQGWNTQPGHTYSVSVAGVSPPIDYAVEVVDCN